jgi:hypothetical protein
MDSLSISLVQDIFRREGRSLMQYVRDAFPWGTAEEQAALAEINAMIESEQQAAAGLARLLTRQHAALPYVGPYPMNFTDVNYISLDHLRPLLIEHQKRSIAHLERDLALLRDAEARGAVQKLLSVKEQHLKRLENLSAPKVAAGAAT